MWVDPKMVVGIRAVPPKLYEGHRTAVLVAPQNREILLVAPYKEVLRNYFTCPVYKAIWEDSEVKSPEDILEHLEEPFRT